MERFRPSRQKLAHPREELGNAQLQAGKIEETPERLGQRTERRDIVERAPEHPLFDRVDQRVVFGHRDELVRADRAEHRMFPAHEALDAGDGPAGQLHRR